MTAPLIAVACLGTWLLIGAALVARGIATAREMPEVAVPEWDAERVARVVGRGR